MEVVEGRFQGGGGNTVESKGIYTLVQCVAMPHHLINYKEENIGGLYVGGWVWGEGRYITEGGCLDNAR